jgi:hypothetical protein
MPERTSSGAGMWDFVLEVLRNHGAVAVALCFVCFLFWRMIWKVWDRAMKAKDEEINRLVIERDKYQSLVFERLMTSRAELTEPPEKDGNK